MRWLLFVVVCAVGCHGDRSTHTKSDALPSLAQRQDFLERYVTFRRHYTQLDFDLAFEDEKGLALGPSTIGCDVRVHAVVPAAELAAWTAGLTAWAGSEDTAWVRTIPNAPASLEGFTWWQGDTRELHRVAVSPATSEVLYWHVCMRN